jgi:hypothetical protein
MWFRAGKPIVSMTSTPSPTQKLTTPADHSLAEQATHRDPSPSRDTTTSRSGLHLPTSSMDPHRWTLFLSCGPFLVPCRGQRETSIPPRTDPSEEIRHEGAQLGALRVWSQACRQGGEGRGAALLRLPRHAERYDQPQAVHNLLVSEPSPMTLSITATISICRLGLGGTSLRRI